MTYRLPNSQKSQFVDESAILFVEQNARKALQCADRGYVLETGTIVLSGSGEALLKSEEVQAAYLGGRA